MPDVSTVTKFTTNILVIQLIVYVNLTEKTFSYISVPETKSHLPKHNFFNSICVCGFAFGNFETNNLALPVIKPGSSFII
jgi:hypothetical protein